MGLVTYTVFDGEIVEENRDGVIRDYVPDSLGSTRALLDENQNITDTWAYWPYGEVESHSGSSDTPFTFVGALGYYSGGSGGTYIRARWYSDSLSSWKQVDGLWPLESSYQYCIANPTTQVDPLGLACQVRTDDSAPGKKCMDILVDAIKLNKESAAEVGKFFECMRNARSEADKKKCLDSVSDDLRELMLRYYGCCKWNEANNDAAGIRTKNSCDGPDPCDSTTYHVTSDCCNARQWACILRCAKEGTGKWELIRCHSTCTACYKECLQVDFINWDTEFNQRCKGIY